MIFDKQRPPYSTYHSSTLNITLHIPTPRRSIHILPPQYPQKLNPQEFLLDNINRCPKEEPSTFLPWRTKHFTLYITEISSGTPSNLSYNHRECSNRYTRMDQPNVSSNIIRIIQKDTLHVKKDLWETL